MPTYGCGSVTQRLLSIPVQSTYACQTRGEKQWYGPPGGEVAAHTLTPCQAELPCACEAVLESTLCVTLPRTALSLLSLLYTTARVVSSFSQRALAVWGKRPVASVAKTGYGQDTCLCRIGHKHVYLADQIMPRSSLSPTFPLGKSPCHVCPTRHNPDMGCFSLLVP